MTGGGGGATTIVAAAPVTVRGGDVDSTSTPRLDVMAAGDNDVSEFACKATSVAVEATLPFCGPVSGMVMTTITFTLPATTRNSR